MNIRQRLHQFNLNLIEGRGYDWTLFDGIPENDQISVMYPEMIYAIGATLEQKKATLVEAFGPLEFDQKKVALNELYGPLK